MYHRVGRLYSYVGIRRTRNILPIERFHVTSSNFYFVAMATKIILQVAKVL